MKKQSATKKTPTIENRKVSYDYFIEETLECGIELRGNEVKSLREGTASIKESWIAIEDNELLIKKMHIQAWQTANKFDVDENRTKRLLATKSQIKDLERKVAQAGYTLMPLKVYFKDNSRVKVLVGLCKGKHNYDKRQVAKEKQAKRDISRAIKAYN